MLDNAVAIMRTAVFRTTYAGRHGRLDDALPARLGVSVSSCFRDSPTRESGNHPIYVAPGGAFARRLLTGSVLLPGSRYTVDDRDADQTEYANANPLLRHVQQVSPDRQAGDQDEVPHKIDPK